MEENGVHLLKLSTQMWHDNDVFLYKWCKYSLYFGVTGVVQESIKLNPLQISLYKTLFVQHVYIFTQHKDNQKFSIYVKQ